MQDGLMYMELGGGVVYMLTLPINYFFILITVIPRSPRLERCHCVGDYTFDTVGLSLS